MVWRIEENRERNRLNSIRWHQKPDWEKSYLIDEGLKRLHAKIRHFLNYDEIPSDIFVDQHALEYAVIEGRFGDYEQLLDSLSDDQLEMELEVPGSSTIVSNHRRRRPLRYF